jgi:hypothetical protein
VDEADIIRLLKALNGLDPAKVFGRSIDNDAANWSRARSAETLTWDLV